MKIRTALASLFVGAAKGANAVAEKLIGAGEPIGPRTRRLSRAERRYIDRLRKDYVSPSAGISPLATLRGLQRRRKAEGSVPLAAGTRVPTDG